MVLTGVINFVATKGVRRFRFGKTWEFYFVVLKGNKKDACFWNYRQF